jgi:hypothetical protein
VTSINYVDYRSFRGGGGGPMAGDGMVVWLGDVGAAGAAGGRRSRRGGARNKI